MPSVLRNIVLTPTQRIMIAIWAIFGVAIVAFIGLSIFTASQMDVAAAKRQRDLIDNSITLRLNQSLSELRSVSWWDEMVVKSSKRDFDEHWLDIEVGVFVTTSYDHDRIILFNEDDRPIYGFGEDRRLSPAELDRYTKTFAPLVAQVRGGKDVSPRVSDESLTQSILEKSAITDRKYGRGAAALVELNGQPVLASVMAVTPSYDMALNPKRPRMLASVIAISPKVMKELGKSVLVPNLTHRSNPEKEMAKFNLTTDAGAKIFEVSWTPEKPGAELLRKLMPFGLGAIAIFLVILGYLGFTLMRSAGKLAERELEAQFLANHDALTGLPNRRSLEREIFVRGADTDGAKKRLACAIIDLDRFKDINDTLGHAAGDELIRVVAQRLRENLTAGDFLARLGGDEFAILRRCEQLEDSSGLPEAIATAFAAPFPVVGHDIESAASVGISMSSHRRAVEELMREADIALYEAKAKQKGSIVQFAPSMASKIEQRRALEIDLKHAIASKALTMAYQPIVESGTGKVTSVEALVRWNSPKHGFVPPDVFVAIAEETGMMADLGRFVIEQSIEDSKRWPDVKTAINISPAQLRSASIVQDLMKPARKYGVSPLQIIIEITETVLLSNDERTLRTLNILKEQGFSLALDDFGTGYSSLAYVRDFPFDKLKIDRSFVQGQKDKGRSLEIVKAVVNFGLILGREVVAEGVETEHEMQAMQAAGVTHLQGYLFSRPISAAHIEALIATSGRLTAARTPSTEAAEPVSTVDRSLATKFRRVA